MLSGCAAMDQFVLVRSNTASGLCRRTVDNSTAVVRRTTGLCLGPLLYILYTAELEQVVTRHGMSLHQYADDSQLYIHVTVSDTAVAERCLAACVSASVKLITGCVPAD